MPWSLFDRSEQLGRRATLSGGYFEATHCNVPPGHCFYGMRKRSRKLYFYSRKRKTSSPWSLFDRSEQLVGNATLSGGYFEENHCNVPPGHCFYGMRKRSREALLFILGRERHLCPGLFLVEASNLGGTKP